MRRAGAPGGTGRGAAQPGAPGGGRHPRQPGRAKFGAGAGAKGARAAGWEGAGPGRVGSVGAAGRRGAAGGRDDVSVCALRKALAGGALGAHLLQPRVWPGRGPRSVCGAPGGRGGGDDAPSPGISGFSPFAGPDRFVFPVELSLDLPIEILSS